MSNDLKNQLIDLLSSNDYDINFNTYEKIRNLILNNENLNDISNDGSAIIRILSQEEYKKYIIDGTCNGSITADNINVWHMQKDKNFSRSLFVEYSKVHEEHSFDRYFSLIQDNNLNQINILDADSYNIYIESSWCPLRSWYKNSNTMSNQGYYWRENQYNFPSAIISKITTAQDTRIEARAANRLYSWTYEQILADPGRTQSLYYSLIRADIRDIACYRPVFQYKDNNKSIDMYR